MCAYVCVRVCMCVRARVCVCVGGWVHTPALRCCYKSLSLLWKLEIEIGRDIIVRLHFLRFDFTWKM